MPPRGRRPARGPRERRELDAKAAKLAAFDLLARKAWSARELTSRLKRRGAPDEIARAVVGELASRGYVDDASFARFWAESRARARRVGSHRLRLELLQKGISRDVAAAAVAAAFEEAPELSGASRRAAAGCRPSCVPGARGRRRGYATTSCAAGTPWRR